MKLKIAFLSVLALAACTPAQPGDGTSSASSSQSMQTSSGTTEDLIILESPTPNAVVKSPLVVTGEARGGWYFEASFPVRLVDANGVELAVVPAQAQGEWMTPEYVPFKATLTFAKPATPMGMLMLHRDNPSGLPENDAHIAIPVKFQ